MASGAASAPSARKKMENQRAGDFRFWIFDFGLRCGGRSLTGFRQSKIQNRKSKIALLRFIGQALRHGDEASRLEHFHEEGRGRVRLEALTRRLVDNTAGGDVNSEDVAVTH